ncbi:type II secretion system protein [Shewanella sp. 202IG2-18]|uniref:PilW family protein n=1 Tax=Parashewanella hymeniacidonis TaxID=2807618 RepID=UPI001960F618|nr:type II secretion system protein [Parashewanella hymeniacidonis]MBM7073070.1 type II secretion system protein [Parashewanella hymeniacidonis]
MIRQSKGFTLVELVTVILILGIVSVGIGSFVVMGTRIFVDSSLTDQVLSESRYALQRMTRELRTAMPNSIRLTTNGSSDQCIEFVPIVVSSSYLEWPFFGDTALNTGKVFRDTSNTTAIQTGQRVYVFPSSEADVYETSSHFAVLDNVDVENDVITLGFTSSVSFLEKSPSKRVYFVEQPVSYCINSIKNELQRYSGYGYRTSQPLLIDDSGSIVAKNIVNGVSNPDDRPFHYEPSTLQSNAIVQLNPRFTINGQTIQYQHQVQVINVP